MTPSEVAALVGAVATPASLVWAFLASRTKAADEASAALAAAMRAERDHERNERARERNEAAMALARLGDKYDTLRKKYDADARRIALEFARVLSPEQLANPDVWSEFPTAVHAAGELVLAAAAPSELPEREARRLGRYARGEALTTPPKGTPGPPRPPRPR